MAINVSDNNPRVNYTATSGQTVFTVPFEFFASTDLTVYVGGSVLATSAYAVTGGSGSTGSITTSSGQTAGAEIAIVRDVPLERTTDLTSSYSASSLNDQLDRIVTQVADLDDRVSRSISLNDYEVGVSLDLPAKASRLGKTVQFNSTTGALEIGPSGNELTSIASIASEITSLNGIKANVTTVAGAISNVNSVGSNISSVTSVASSISNVNTVNTNIANVNSVAGSISDLNDVADSLDQVELVGGSISNVDVVGAAISNVNTVASGISNINIVAGISGNVATVAGITSAISTVNSNATNINTAATNIANVNVVANVITKVTTVSDNIANVNTVAPSVSYLSTVANNIANINTLAPISADITTVAGVASSVSGAAANAAAAEAAKVAAQAAQAAAELAADNFDDTYLGAKASDPTLDNDGDSLGNGDLYFNTTDGTLKVYNNSAWQAAALDASGFVDVTGDSMTGNLLFGDGNEARFGTHGDLTIEHDLNNSNIIAANNKPLNITANGGFNINSDNIYFREHAASNTYMEMRDGGGYDHAVRIFHSGTDVRLETTSTGIDVTGTVTMDGGSTSADFTFGDNDKAIFGAGSDLQIYHDVADNNSYIKESGTGDLLVFANKFIVKSASGASSFIQADPAATDVKLFYGNVEKLATTSTGVDITGTITSDGLTVGSTVPALFLMETDQTDKNAYVRSSGGFFQVKTINDALDTQKSRLAISHATGDISFYEDTGTTAKFFWDASAESLGIGTSSPDTELHVEADTPVFRLTNPQTTSSLGLSMGKIEWETRDASAAGVIGYIDVVDSNNFGTTFDMAFATGQSGSATERMRIDSSGNLLVGKTSVGFSADGFEARASGQVYITDTTATPLVVRRNSTDGTIAEFYKDSSTVGSIGTVGSDIVIGSGNIGIRFYEADNSIIPSSAAGQASDGTLDIGDGSFRWKDAYLSGGVYLGGTAATNKLDDYEDGSWTVNLYKGGSALAVTNRYGYYRRVGDLLHISFYWLNNSITTTGTSVYGIRGMPFNLLALNNMAYQFCPVGYNSIDSNNFHRWQANSSTELQMYGAGGATNVSSGLLEFSGTGVFRI